MTLYMFFAVVGLFIYAGAVYAADAVSALGARDAASALHSILIALLFVGVATTILSSTAHALRLPRMDIGHARGWKTRVFVVVAVVLACGVSLFAVSTGEFANARACALRCGDSDAVSSEVGLVSPAEVSAGMAVAELARVEAAGAVLFQERGCALCHRADDTGMGPALQGLFGSVAQDPGCGLTVVDETYVREAIVSPASTVAVGFASVMPTFGGQLTEDELQALILHVRSLSIAGR